jgi:3-phenylpropionate/trans-cinnamate dioxygenase ferredoxin component
MNDDGFRTVGPVAQLSDNDVQPYYLRDRKLRLNVARVAGRLHAFDGLCAHEHSPLSGGVLEDTTIMCQCHGSTYELRTSAVLRGPATEGLAVYEVREHQGEIQVKV